MIPSAELSWSRRAPLPLPRAGCAVGVLQGRLFVAGGTCWESGRKVWCDRADSFDPATDTWTAHPPVPRLAGDGAGAAIAGRFVVIGGGGDGPGAASVWAFDGRTWTRWPDLPAGRRSCVAAVHDGKLFVLGGLAGSGTEFDTATATVWWCNPGGEWHACAPLPAPARFNLAVGSVNGSLLVAGGCTPERGTVRNLDEILAYDVRADAWAGVGRLPEPCRGSFGLAAGPQLLLFGGYTDRFRSEVLAFDAHSGAVRPAGHLPVGLADSRFAWCGGRLFGVSGEDGIKHRYPETLEAAGVGFDQLSKLAS